MPPKKKHAVVRPSGDGVRWVENWPYRVYGDGLVKVGTGAKGSAFPAWTFRLTSYEDCNLDDDDMRDQCVLQEVIRRYKGWGPGPGSCCSSMLRGLISPHAFIMLAGTGGVQASEAPAATKTAECEEQPSEAVREAVTECDAARKSVAATQDHCAEGYWPAAIRCSQRAKQAIERFDKSKHAEWTQLPNP